MSKLNSSSKVFVNRTLNMKRINYIGLDMDHTLVRYNSVNFERLAHKTMLEKLVKIKGYPEKILTLPFSYESTIRGLVIDKNKGNLIKLSRYGAIRTSRHGLKPIDYDLQRKIYKSTYIDLGDPQYEAVDTAFSLSFATLFAQLVDLKSNDTSCGQEIPEYPTIAEDLNQVLDSSHRDGSIKSVVKNNLSDYIIRDETLVHTIYRYLKHGKKFFIVTNSDFEYTKLLLDYAISPFLQKGHTWLDIFDVVITSAQKPRFFYDNLKYLKIDPKTGLMTNLGTDKITSGVYQGGCADQFTQDMGLEPDEILYVGDHIYGDILRLKKDCAWRTALVVEEIEDEIKKNKEAAKYNAEISKFMEQKIPLERELDELISQKIETGNSSKQSQIDELLKKVTDIDHKISPLIKAQDEAHNSYWGELMRAGIEESYFAYQVERFACIYMSRLTDLLEMSPRTYYRSHRRLMAHDLESV